MIELADETFNRVARRLLAGETIQAAQPVRYCYGVARNMLREYFAQAETMPQPLDELRAAEHPRADPHESQARLHQRLEKERWLELLSRAVRELPQASGEMLLAYGWGEKRARIEHRKALAAQLGITVNALKIRVCRIRAALEKRLLEQMPQL